MAEYDAKLHVKNSTGYDDINLKSKSSLMNFDATGTNLTSTNSEDAIKEVNTKALTSSSVVNDLATAIATTVDGVPCGTKVAKSLNTSLGQLNESLANTKSEVTALNSITDNLLRYKGDCQNANNSSFGIYTTSNTTENLDTWGYLIDISVNIDWKCQIHYSTDGHIRIRCNINNSGWSKWYVLAMS